MQCNAKNEKWSKALIHSMSQKFDHWPHIILMPAEKRQYIVRVYTFYPYYHLDFVKIKPKMKSILKIDSEI